MQWLNVKLLIPLLFCTLEVGSDRYPYRRGPPPPRRFDDSHESLEFHPPPRRRIEQCPECEICDQSPRFNFALQAGTLAEAVLNFPDLTKGTTLTASRLSSDSSTTAKTASRDRCNSVECRGCATLLMDRMVTQGTMERNKADATLEEIGGRADAKHCRNRYAFQDIERKTNSPPKYEGRRTNGDDCTVEKALQREKFLKITKSTPQLDDVSAPLQDGLGTLHKIACIKRGETESEGAESWLSLCTICWAWRELPPEYEPRFINELICDNSPNDGHCFSGIGKCAERRRSVDVLKNMGTEPDPYWVRYSLSTAAVCECRIPPGTGLYNLIQG